MFQGHNLEMKCNDVYIFHRNDFGMEIYMKHLYMAVLARIAWEQHKNGGPFHVLIK